MIRCSPYLLHASRYAVTPHHRRRAKDAAASGVDADAAYQKKTEKNPSVWARGPHHDISALRGAQLDLELLGLATRRQSKDIAFYYP